MQEEPSFINAAAIPTGWSIELNKGQSSVKGPLFEESVNSSCECECGREKYIVCCSQCLLMLLQFQIVTD